MQEGLPCKAATSANPKGKSWRIFQEQDQRIWQAQGLCNKHVRSAIQDSGTQSISFLLFCSTKILKLSGFSRIFYVFLVYPPHSSSRSDCVLPFVAIQCPFPNYRVPYSSIYVSPVVSQPSKKLSQANDVAVLFLGPCLVLGKARTF